jgi:deaminated glutathione amidase
MAKTIVAAIQMSSGSDKGKNLRLAADFVTEAARKGARLVALPELFSWQGSSRQIPLASEPIPGFTSTRMAELAARLKIFLLCGSILETNPHGPRPFNTSFLINPSGRIIGMYRKIHLFKVRMPNGTALNEKAAYTAGTGIVTAPTPLGRIGLSICYDLRFPELYRALLDRGAAIITVPSSFTFATGKDHWEVLLRARAIENQVFVVAPNQHGRDPQGTRRYGHSMIIDPWGNILASHEDGNGVICAQIDRTFLKQVRYNLPCLRQRRKAMFNPERPSS